MTAATTMGGTDTAAAATVGDKPTLAGFRKEMKALGYRVTVKRYSDFKAAVVTAADGTVINAGNVFIGEQGRAHLEAHAGYYDYKRRHGSIFEDGWRIVL